MNRMDSYRILQEIFHKLETQDSSTLLRLNSKEATILTSTGLLRPATNEFDVSQVGWEAEAAKSIHVLDKNGCRQEMNLMGDNGAISSIDTFALKKFVEALLIEEFNEKYAVSENDKEQEPQHGQKSVWQEKEKRRVGIDRHAKVPMEVLMRPEVRPDIIALGVAHGMAGQKYIEHLIVNSVNDNPELVTKGKQYIKHAKGNIRRAIAIAREDMHLSSEDLEHTPPTSRSI